MTEPLKMTGYHRAVINALKTLSWVADADTYPETATQLTTPAVYFSVDAWKPASTSTGQLEAVLECSLYVVVDRSGEYAEKPDLYVRAAAADLTQWIEGQQFGMEAVEPAVFVAAAADEFDPQMDTYHVWRITFDQRAAFGADPFATSGAPLQAAFLGQVPAVGEQHIADYRKIWEHADG